MKTQVNEINARLQRFKPSGKSYKVPFLGSYMTEGIRLLATTQEYFEIFMGMTTIGRKYAKSKKKIIIDFKRLTPDRQDYFDSEAEVIYTNLNGKFLQKNSYCETDFPFDELRLLFINDTLMLPIEYRSKNR